MDPNREYSLWSELPDLLLEEVFSYLSVQERYYASLVSVFLKNFVQNIDSLH